MSSRLRARLTYANVVATLALFVALGGSSYAALTITGKNVKNSSLTGADIKNNSVTGKDVKRIGSGDVSDRSLLARDFKSGQLPAGATGPAGARGASGSPAASMLTGAIDGGALPIGAGSAALFAPTGHSTAAGGQSRSPNADVVLRDLAVWLQNPPGSGTSRTIFVGAVDAGDQSGPHVSCTVADTDTTCDSGTQTATVPPNSLLTVVVRNNNAGGAPSTGYLEYGYRATTP